MLHTSKAADGKSFRKRKSVWCGGYVGRSPAGIRDHKATRSAVNGNKTICKSFVRIKRKEKLKWRDIGTTGPRRNTAGLRTTSKTNCGRYGLSRLTTAATTTRERLRYTTGRLLDGCKAKTNTKRIKPNNLKVKRLKLNLK